jgi:hypothetical protein
LDKIKTQSDKFETGQGNTTKPFNIIMPHSAHIPLSLLHNAIKKHIAKSITHEKKPAVCHRNVVRDSMLLQSDRLENVYVRTGHDMEPSASDMV